MKKIILLALCALAIVSCKKNNDTEQPTPMVTISFEQRIVEGHSMVRSASNDFLDIIEEQTPKVVTVTLKNTDLNKTYTCESTETITIPVGNYELSAKSNNTTGSALIATYVYATPVVKLNKTTVNITTQSTKIQLNLSYDCYAIFALIDECQTCEIKAEGYQYEDMDKIGKYFVAYSAHDAIYVKLTPYSDSTNFSATENKFVTSYDAKNIFVELGKYYVVHPTKIDSTTSSFEVNMPTMEEGEI